MGEFASTAKTRLGRYPNRGVFDKEKIYSILDEGFICHVGFVIDSQPFVIPTGYARLGDTLYIHGSAASRMLKSVDYVCITVTLVDGLVLARSGFHHSMNYRSVVVLGKARLVTDAEEKVAALRAFTNHIVPGRWDEVRPPTEQELKATKVLAVELEEVSAKMRQGPPIDDEEDYELPIWAGVVPLGIRAGEPVPDERMVAGIAPIDPQRFIR
jgi:nitroimidazol reductase NimA-like FMN-containing flavoprotein (pyridoxamine 5'-phosphate oxidase superfamily)